MEHDRFDDVEVRFLHDPDQPPEPPRRRRRWVIAAAATALAAGALAAGASAVGGSGEDTRAPAAEKHRGGYPEGGYSHMRQGKPCDRDGRHRDRGDRSEFRY